MPLHLDKTAENCMEVNSGKTVGQNPKVKTIFLDQNRVEKSIYSAVMEKGCH